jgi:hypothetical protein
MSREGGKCAGGCGRYVDEEGWFCSLGCITVPDPMMREAIKIYRQEKYETKMEKIRHIYERLTKTGTFAPDYMLQFR